MTSTAFTSGLDSLALAIKAQSTASAATGQRAQAEIKMAPMLVRVRTRLGQARVSVEPTDTLAALADKLQQEQPALPQFKLSRDPGHKDYLGPAGANMKQLGLQHGDLIFADHQAVAEPEAPATPSKTHRMGMTLTGTEVVEISEQQSPAAAARVAPKDVKLDEVDEVLSKLDGREKLKGSDSKRGFGSASIDSMAVEPYDDRLLKEKDIKLMSFHAYLRKLKSVQGGGKFSKLQRHDFGTYGEAGGKGGQEQGWGERAVAMSRIPKPMTLNRQKYRHVDRVQIADPKILDRFLDAWRSTGAMRYGYLYGYYQQDTTVPLGIVAVVKAIYEPPQDCAADGVNMNEDPQSETVDHTAALLGMRKIGWIFLDLEVMGNDGTKFVCSRGKDSYFLRSNEVVLAAHLQNQHLSPCKESDDGFFGSKFVTVVVTGNEQNELDYVAYQVSQQAMDLEQADGILEYTTHLDKCRVAMPSENRYVPAIFYQDISEFGNQTTHSANPFLPLDYLIVSVNGPTFPQEVDANAIYTNNFPVENRIVQMQTVAMFKEHLNNPENKPFRPTGQLKTLSDFHMILFLACNPHLWGSASDAKEGVEGLCRIVKMKDSGKAADFMQSRLWKALLDTVNSAAGAGPSRSANVSTGSPAGGFGEFGAGAGPARPSTAGGGVNYDDQAEQLAQMGFDKERAREILQIVNGSMELALDMLSS